jgi:hypothetical protein
VIADGFRGGFPGRFRGGFPGRFPVGMAAGMAVARRGDCGPVAGEIAAGFRFPLALWLTTRPVRR